MRMICKEYGIDYVFDENYATELLIESSDLLQTFVQRLLQQANGGDDYIILSRANSELRFDKVAEMIIDPFNLDINNRKIISRIYQGIMQECNENIPENYITLKTMMEQFIIGICENSEFFLTYDSNPDFINILKMYDVRIDNEDTDLQSRILNYIKLLHRLLNIELFVFVNLKSFISKEILVELYQTLCYEKVNVLLIERQDYGLIENEHRIIIDQAACVLYDK